MPRGPTVAPSLDPSTPTPIRQQVAEVDPRGRLHIPSAFAKSVDWLAPGSEILAVLDEPGRLTLLSWKDEGAPILARQHELLEMADTDEEANDLLLLIEDRYQRIIIPRDRRPTLYDHILLHLGILNDLPVHVYLECVSDILRILSSAYRNRRLAASVRILGELP